ncbi:putative reverse transcriptase domain-containing protein [Tanacetum coccineum]
MDSSSGTTNVTSTLESLGNTFGKESEGLNLSSNGIASSPSISYAKLITGEPSRKTVNFRTLLSPARNGANVAISLEYVRPISERFANTIYGFFLRKRVVYPFSSKDGMDAMLENGPWFIQNNPFILKKWNPDVNLLKEDVGNVSVWVKFHGVPMTAFSTLLMLDSYTIVVAISKLVGEGFYMCTIRIEYEWKPPRCSSCKVFGHVLDDCLLALKYGD